MIDASLVLDAKTLKVWLDKLGYDVAPEGDEALRIRAREGDSEGIPPFFVQLSENWVVLSILPMPRPPVFDREDLHRRLLLMNREMLVAKFALDKEGAVVLSAELPTESLDYSELEDAIERLTEHAVLYHRELGLA